MSSSRNSKLSAYQVFSKVTKMPSNASKKQTLEDSKEKRKTNPKTIFDSQRESKSAPKSLIAMVIESDAKGLRSGIPGKRIDSNMKQMEGKAHSANNSVQSLLDISFDRPSLQVDRQFLYTRQKGKSQSGPLLSRTTTNKSHSYPESSDTHRKVLVPESVILPTAKLKPLVVEMQPQGKSSSPQPLLDLNLTSSLKNMPTRLFDLPQTRQRKSNFESSSQLMKSKVETQTPQRISDSKKKRQGDDNAVTPESEIEIHSGWEKGPSLSKKAKFDESHKLKKILTCWQKNCCFLIIPSSCSWLHLNGKARLCVEKGTVSIMAFTLQPTVDYDVFSPATGCLLAMHVDDTCKISAHDVKSEMTRLCGSKAVDDRLKDLCDDTIAVIRVQELKSGVCDYLTSFIPFTQLFKVSLPRDHEKLDLVGVSLVDLGIKVAPQAELTHTCMKWSPEYNDALEKWAKKISSSNTGGQSPVLLTCGGKNSGKSILNRCAINVTLQSVKEVAYLDCDVGQTEFSPPATLSLHLIKSPILGPPFCHQRHAEKMVFYGDVNPSQDPGFYVRCLRSVFQTYVALASKTYLPLIVNTMGFPEGVGLMIFIDTMNIMKPDLVIQLEGVLQYNNFPPITQEMVALDEGWTVNKCPSEDPSKKVGETKAHDLIILSSLSCPKRELSFTLKFRPMDLRNLALLSSLSMGLEKDVTLMSATPFAVPFKHIAVHVCHHRLSQRESLNAVDASLVALCEADLSKATKNAEELPWMFEETPTCHCLGMGIVRAVDATKGDLLIVTTLPWDMLSKVNAVLKGSLTLPDHFFLNQNKSATSLPYVDALAPSTAVTPVRPRARMPRVSLGKEKNE